jgi:hypothetical protein
LAESEPQVKQDKDGKKSARLKAITLAALGAASLLLVVFFGWYQFSHRAKGPVELVKQHAIPGTDTTIGEGIENFIRDKGVQIVREGFKPSWGAEETGKNVFRVSYVYEVDREAHWISWRVIMPSGEVKPEGEWARELRGGD